MKKLLFTSLVLIVASVAWLGYERFASPTRVAFVNYMDFMYDQILEANDNSFIKIEQVGLDSNTFKNADQYDALYLFAHGGVRLSGEQKEQVRQAILSGTAVIYNSPIPTPELDGLGEKNIAYITKCLQNSTTSNISRMLNYTRKVFDNKKLFVEPITDPFIHPRSFYYHLGEEEVFEHLDDYSAFLRESGRYKQSGKNIALVASQFGASTDDSFINQLVTQLEESGHNVFPLVAYGPARVEYVKAVNPDMVIYNAHGKFGGQAGIKMLSDANIPMLCPVVVFSPNEVWRASKQGMDGGLLSMNVTMPELDGGVVPFALGAQFKNERGLYVFRGIKERIDTFTSLTNKFLALQDMPNQEKKLAIFYLKEPGKNALVAESLEVVPSLLNLLKRLNQENYNTGDLPDTPEELEALIQQKGSTFGTYANGSIENFRLNGDPLLLSKAVLEEMLVTHLDPSLVLELEQKYGPPPGDHMSFSKQSSQYLMLPRIELGNIVLLPVPSAESGDAYAEMVHGAKSPPPYPYVAAYLWARTQFNADAILHFGTHGSVEFTPEKQVALAKTDWPDALLAGTPHFYVYVISNVGEATIAKRRSYAVMQSHLTSPLTKSGLYGSLLELDDLLEKFWNSENPAIRAEYHKLADSMIRTAELNLDIGVEVPDDTLITEDQLLDLHHYLHDVEMAKIISGLHVLGEPYSSREIKDTVHMMAQDSLVYNSVKMEQSRGKVTEAQLADAHFMEEHYREPAKHIIDSVLAGKRAESFISLEQNAFLTNSNHAEDAKQAASGVHANHGSEHSHRGRSGVHASSMQQKPSLDKSDQEYLTALQAYKNTLMEISNFEQSLLDSPTLELDAIVNSLNGGYTEPQTGGDPAFNPDAVPGGRNHISINADKVPTTTAYTVAKQLIDALLEKHLEKNGDYPKRVALTLWSSEFIRQEGITIAQALYLLGVEPIADRRGTVHDVKLIPIEQLGRPRIDVVVQTSGQFRDIAASRIYLINRAAKLAAEADGESNLVNYVLAGTRKAEALMKENGTSPDIAREHANVRVFGGLNGNYGASIMGMVENSDSWQSEDEVADRYLTSMGAMYGKGLWGKFLPGAFEAALSNAQVVIQPRSSSTWGALSLDHVYEFMGGISNAIRKVSGYDPSAYFSDLRSPDNPTVQSLESAIWTESRTTLLNPKYIKGMQVEGATAADTFAETFRNIFSWEVMKTSAVDPQLWDNLSSVYVDDIYDLNIEGFFRDRNPYALQEMSAVMLESIRKGYWKPNVEVQKKIADLHVSLVRDYEAGCTGFVCDNFLLREFISEQVDAQIAEAYKTSIDNVLTVEQAEPIEGIELNKVEEIAQNQKVEDSKQSSRANQLVWLFGTFLLLVAYIVFRRFIKS